MKKKNSIVKKHNSLINGRAEFMDVRELRIIAQTAARITINDEDFATYYIPISEISPNNKNIYEEIKDITDKLMKRVVTIEDTDENNIRTFSKYTIFSTCSYTENSGYLKTKFHPDLKPYYLQLKNNFTQLNVEILGKLPSTYSYRLYEILKSYKEKYGSEMECEIKELQEKLNINETHAPSYRKWHIFTEKVLKPAQRHIKERTDLEFKFKGYAEFGRKFTHIKFKIEKKKDIEKRKERQKSLASFAQFSTDKLKLLANAGNQFAQKELEKRT